MSLVSSFRAGLKTATPFFEGVETAHTLNLCKNEEDTVRLGSRRVLSAAMQIIEVSFAFKHVQHIYEAYGKANPLPVSFRSVQFCGFVLPGFITYAASRADHIKHPLVKRAITLLHDNIGTISHVATLVTSVALIAIGHVALGVTTIAVLGIGYLCRSRLMPYEVRSAWDKSSFLISSITKLAIGGPFDKTIAIIEIALNVFIYISEKRQESKLKHVYEQVDNQKLTTPFAQMANLTLDHIEISDFHLLYSEYYIPPAPEGIELSQLKDKIYANVNWENHRELIEKKCEEDDQWRDFQSRNHREEGSTRSLEEKASLCQKIESIIHRIFNFFQPIKTRDNADPHIGHIEEGLTLLIDGISHKRLHGQEPKEYKTLQNKLKHIIALLEKKDEITRVNTLASLGLSAYGCSGSPYRAIDETFAQLYGTDPEQTLTGQMYHQLQWNRDRIFEGVIHKCFDPKEKFKINPKKGSTGDQIATFWKGIFTPEDIHNYHTYANLIAPEFGLSHAAGARNDQIALSDAIDEWLFSHLYTKERKVLAEGYSKEAIFDIIKDNLINRHISTTIQSKGIQEWLKSIYTEQHSSLECSEIEDDDDFAMTYFDEVTEKVGDTTTLKDSYIIAYLISIGVFQLKNKK